MKVVPLPVGNLRDIASMARKFADEFEAGNYGNHVRALLVLEGEGIEMFLWGDDLTNLAAIGILDCAKARVISDMIDA